MQKKPYLIWAYAVITFIGGIIGYKVAGSLISILASTTIACLLAGCGYGIKKGSAVAYYTTMGILCFVLAFFGYRFSLQFKIMPAGMMLLLTVSLLLYLFATRNQTLSSCSDCSFKR
jgi:uncharacterized membrane protein (UPF0136 family)